MAHAIWCSYFVEVLLFVILNFPMYFEPLASKELILNIIHTLQVASMLPKKAFTVVGKSFDPRKVYPDLTCP